MMLVLLANLRLWRGRAKARCRSGARRALFHSIGDHYGRAMALTATSRSLAAVGDVAEVEKALEEVMSATTGSLREKMSEHRRRDVRAGDGDRALTSLIAAESDPNEKPGLGDLEWMVSTGLAYLQVAKVDEALTLLEGAAEQSPTSPYALSAFALASAAIGEPENAIGLADAAESFSGASYLDRNTAGAARVLALAQMGDESAARKALTPRPRFIDSTDDQLLGGHQAGWRRALACLGDESAGGCAPRRRPSHRDGRACRRLDDGLRSPLGRGAGEGGGS
jgi:tetratricopeptide (TPR) repeat protein